MAGCPKGNPTFIGKQARGQLGKHLMDKKYHDSTNLPDEALNKFGHEPCSYGCGKLFTHTGNRLVHEKRYHPAEGRDAPLARTKASAGSAALRKAALQISKIEYANILSKNAPHLKELRPNVTDLLHVQGSAYQSLPAPVAMMTDAAFAMIFKAGHENLDSDLPGVFLAAFPRYVMAPPDGSDPVSYTHLTLPTILRV